MWAEQEPALHWMYDERSISAITIALIDRRSTHASPPSRSEAEQVRIAKLNAKKAASLQVRNQRWFLCPVVLTGVPHTLGSFYFLQLEAQVEHISDPTERAAALRRLKRESKLKGSTTAVAKAEIVRRP